MAIPPDLRALRCLRDRAHPSRLAALAVLGAACGPARTHVGRTEPPPSALPKPSVLASPAPLPGPSAITAKAPRPKARDLITLPWPKNAACTVDGTKGGVDPDVPLRLGPGRDVFATAHDTTVLTVALVGPDDAPAAIADVESEGVLVRGAVDVAALRVHPSHALVLGAFFIPREGSSFVLERLVDGGVAVRPLLDPNIVPVHTLVDQVQCTDLSIDRPKFSAASALPQRPGRSVEFVPGVAHFSLTESGAAAVDVHIASGGTTGHTLAKGAGADRVSVDLDGDIVFGWVAHGAYFNSSPPGRVTGGSSHHTKGPRTARIRTDSCERELSLSAVTGGATQVVGVVQPGTPFDVVSEASAVATIHLVAASISTAPGVELRVDESDGHCAPVEAP